MNDREGATEPTLALYAKFSEVFCDTFEACRLRGLLGMFVLVLHFFMVQSPARWC